MDIVHVPNYLIEALYNDINNKRPSTYADFARIHMTFNNAFD